MNNHKELIVWQKSMDLAELVYNISNAFPEEEKFGLISQIRRSVVSVASNIAEGAGRNSTKEFKQFLSFANGSLNEVSTQLELGIRLNFLNAENISNAFHLIEEI